MTHESRVADATHELITCLQAAEQLITEPDQPAPAMITGSGHPSASSPPWNAPAAAFIFGARTGARVLETRVRGMLGRPGHPRGGSDTNTAESLTWVAHASAALADHTPGRVCPHTPRHRRCCCDTCQVVRVLMALTAPGLRLPAVDRLTRWSPIRAGTGGLPPKCPFCGTYSLRVAELAYTVACFKPGCCDSGGDRPAGRLEVSKLTGWAPGIVWADRSVTTVPAGQ